MNNTPAADATRAVTEAVKKRPSKLIIYWKALASFDEFWTVLLGAALITGATGLFVGLQYLGYFMSGSTAGLWSGPFVIFPLLAGTVLILVGITIYLTYLMFYVIYKRAQKIEGDINNEFSS